ncbi:MAG: EamA family transporter [Thiolinea sp.]
MRVGYSHGVLLLVALVWGGGFVAQKSGMDYLGPFSFNTARFVLAALSLVPVWFLLRPQLLKQARPVDNQAFWLGGLLAGTLLAGG